jgi:hypothetical protein
VLRKPVPGDQRPDARRRHRRAVGDCRGRAGGPASRCRSGRRAAARDMGDGSGQRHGSRARSIPTSWIFARGHGAWTGWWIRGRGSDARQSFGGTASDCDARSHLGSAPLVGVHPIAGARSPRPSNPAPRRIISERLWPGSSSAPRQRSGTS